MSATDNITTNAPTSLSEAIGRSWWIVLLYGIAAVIFGLLAIRSPVAAAGALTWIAGVLALVDGVIGLVALFGRDHQVSRGWLAFYAVVSILFGILALANPIAMAGALILLLAAWLIVGGIYRIVFAIQVRKVIDGEWLLILSGLLSIVLGILFVANPLTGVYVTALWIGICAIVFGAVQIFGAFKLRKLAK